MPHRLDISAEAFRSDMQALRDFPHDVWAARYGVVSEHAWALLMRCMAHAQMRVPNGGTEHDRSTFDRLYQELCAVTGADIAREMDQEMLPMTQAYEGIDELEEIVMGFMTEAARMPDKVTTGATP